MDRFIWCFAAMLTVAGWSLGQSDKIMTLTSKDGRVVQGDIGPGTKTDHIHLKRSNGTVYRNIPLSSFSSESQQAIHHRLKEIETALGDAALTDEAKLKISFQRQKSDRKNDYGDIDDQVLKLQPRITIESDETKKTFQSVKGEVIIIGQEILRKKQYIILDRQSVQFPVISPYKTIEWEGKPFEFKYDPDYGGFDYEGYLIVLRNKKGEVVITKGSSATWTRTADALVKAKKLTGYDKSFTKTASLYTTYGLPTN